MFFPHKESTSGHGFRFHGRGTGGLDRFLSVLMSRGVGKTFRRVDGSNTLFVFAYVMTRRYLIGMSLRMLNEGRIMSTRGRAFRLTPGSFGNVNMDVIGCGFLDAIIGSNVTMFTLVG